MRLPLLFLHIAGGMVGLLSGTVAMVYRKGSRGHRVTGNIFVVAMLIMGTSATWLAVLKQQTDNIFGGLLTIYMIATAWLTSRRRDRETSLFDWGAFVFASALTASLVTRAVLISRGLAALQPGVPLGMLFFTATIPLLAAVGDLRMLLGGGISGTPRIARHLWRMCYGLFIATGYFPRKATVFPCLPAQTIFTDSAGDPAAGDVDLLDGACRCGQRQDEGSVCLEASGNLKQMPVGTADSSPPVYRPESVTDRGLVP